MSHHGSKTPVSKQRVSHTPALTRRAVRWLPAVVAPVLVAGIAIAAPMAASASPSLPSKSPQQILQLIAKGNSIGGLSGTVQQTSNLGLPQLPTTGVGADSDITSTLNLLTGTHTARVYESGASDRRVQVLDSMGERDVIEHGTSVWTYDSTTKAATHVTLPAQTLGDRGGKEHPMGVGEEGTATTVTPAEAAQMLLAKIGTTTAVTSQKNVSVAGRSAYSLVLTPRTSGSLVGSVTIAVDSATGLPLQVQVFAKDQTSPAFSTGFTSISLTKPAASLFAFAPPKGATVKQIAAPKTTYSGSYTPMRVKSHPAIGARPTVTGTGWSSIVTIAAKNVPKSLTSSPLYKESTTAAAGGRVISTSLLNVLVTTDGRVLAGSVSVSALEAAAAKQ